MKAGITQGELAERVGLSRPYITQLEKGQRRLNSQTQRDIAAALGVNPVELVDFDAPDEAEEALVLNVYRELSGQARKEFLQLVSLLQDRKK